MPNDLLVHPGDLITADLWNKLLAAIDRVDGRIDAAEARVVPDVVGDLLPIALDEIARAGFGLSTILDTEGTRVLNVTDAAVASRIVLAQTPPPDDRVEVGRRLALLITAARVAKANQPDITQVNPIPAGPNAQVGKGLEIIGTSFVPPLSVTIGKTNLLATQFIVNGPTKITVPTVPSFVDRPGPGQTLAVGIAVANSNGGDTFSVNFVEPALVAKQPTISNVYIRQVETQFSFDIQELALSRRAFDPLQTQTEFFFSIQGAALSQTGLDTTVTVAGETLTFTPVSANELTARVPNALQTSLRNIQPTTVLPLLLAIDALDIFLLDGLPPSTGGGKGGGVLGGGGVSDFNVNNAFLRSTSADRFINTGTEAQPAAVDFNAIDLNTGFLIDRNRLTDFFFDTDLFVQNHGKLFLLLTQTQAETIVNAADTRFRSLSPPRAVLNGNIVTVTAGNTSFTVDATKLTDFPIVVKVGDKTSATFRLKLGAVSVK